MLTLFFAIRRSVHSKNPVKFTAGKALCLLIFSALLVSVKTKAQVATYYIWSQSNQTYKSDTSTTSTVPANTFVTGWDDATYTAYRFPFTFNYNGTTYVGGTGTVGVDTDGWVAFSTTGTITMTGTTAGGSWISASDHTGVYLNGTGNNNGFCGFNSDLQDQVWSDFTANTSNGSSILSNVSDFSELRVGTRLSATGINDGTIITKINLAAGTVTISSAATATGTAVVITPRTSIYAFTRGIAPYRQFVIQWTRTTRYSGAGTGDDFSFQLVLNEGGGDPNFQTLQVVYGTCKATNTIAQNAQVGLRGAAKTDFNARTTTTDWSATTAAPANTSTCSLTNSVFPNSGLTYTWSPACPSIAANAGAISGPTNVCPGSTVDYSIAGVPGAIYYTWTYTGTNTSYSGTTTLPLNTLVFDVSATGGTLTVTPGNLCGPGASSSIVISMNGLPSATVNYPASSYCTSAAPATPTITGTLGGTFTTSPSGLSINASTGQITPSTSAAGNYVVTYTYTSGCTATVSNNITINAGPAATATATPANFCSSPNSSQLQVAVPVSNYTLASIPFTSLTPAAGSTVLWNTYQLDNISGSIAMPFTFNYYGSPITNFFVSTEGYVQLQTGTVVEWVPQTLPNATVPNNIIALAWADLIVDPSTNPGSSVRYFVNGTAPNRILVIDYINLRFLAGSGQNVTGQIRLYENDSHIEIAAGTVNDNGDLWSKTMGIENSTGTLATTPPGRNNVVWNTINEAWSFTPASNTYLYAWSPGSFLSSTSIANPVANNVTSTTTYTVTVTNISTGCSGTSTATIALTAAMSGVYTVGAGGNFTTLTAAVAAYNAGCINGPVVFSLIDNSYPGETFPITINSNANASSINTLTIKPALTKTPTITGSSAVAIIKMFGADYITIDGSNTTGGTSKDLTFINTSTNAITSTIIWLASVASGNGATNNTIKNCNLTGNAPTTTFTSVISSGTTVGGIAEAANNNNSYINNKFIRAQTAIAVVGPSGNETGTIITGNTIGSTVAGDKFGWSGIETYQQANCTVTNNNIFGITSSDGLITTSGISVYGTASNITISYNTISDVKHTNSLGYGSNGMFLVSSSTGANVNIFNNMIYDIASYGYNGGRDYFDNGYGIMVYQGSGYNIYYNTVNLNTSQTAAGFPACLNVGSTVTTAKAINLKNNLFNNSQAGPSGQRYAIECTAAASVFDTINYNGYYTVANNPGYLSGNLATLAAIQTAFGKNTNSFVPAVGLGAVFKSATDMHIDTTNATNIANWKNKGGAIATYTDDYDVTTRNGLTPDVGADEWVEGKYGSWVGKTSIDWLVPSNWEANVVPDRGTDVFITGGYTFMPTIVTPQPVRNLALSAPGTPPILTISGGTLQVYGTMSRTGGTIDGSNGTLEMDSSIINQPIPASMFTNNNLKNLIVNNSASPVGVAINGPLDIYRSVTFGASGANLTTNSNLTFKSTATETAWLGNVTGKTITGTATVERYIPTGINHGKSWQLLGLPVKGTTSLKASWMENNTPGLNSKPGYGTTVSSEVINAVTMRGWDFYTPIVGGAGGPSIKTYVPASNTWAGIDDGVTPTGSLKLTSSGAVPAKAVFVFVRGDRSVVTVGAAATPTVLRCSGTLYTTGANTPPNTNVGAGLFATVANPYASAIDFALVGRAAGVDNVFYVWDPKLNGSQGLGGYQTFSGVTGFLPTPGGTSNYPSGVAVSTIQSGQAFFVHGTGGGNVSFTEAAKVAGSTVVLRQQSNDRQLLGLNLYRISTEANGPVDGNIIVFDKDYSNNFEKKDALKIVNASENIGIYSNEKLLAVEARKPVKNNDTIFYNMANLRQDAYRFKFGPTHLSFTNLQAFLVDRFLTTMTEVSLHDSTVIDFSVTADQGSYAADRFYLVFRKSRITPLQSEPAILVRNANTSKTSVQAMPSISIYPNPVVNKKLSVSFVNQEPGMYQVRLSNKLGQLVISKTILLKDNSSVETLSLNEDIAAGNYQVTIISENGNKTTQQVIVNP